MPLLISTLSSILYFNFHWKAPQKTSVYGKLENTKLQLKCQKSKQFLKVLKTKNMFNEQIFLRSTCFPSAILILNSCVKLTEGEGMWRLIECAIHCLSRRWRLRLPNHRFFTQYEVSSRQREWLHFILSQKKRKHLVDGDFKIPSAVRVQSHEGILH